VHRLKRDLGSNWLSAFRTAEEKMAERELAEEETEEIIDYKLYPKREIDDRIKRLQSRMGEMDGALLFQSVDMCYFSGTAQDGLVYIPRDGEPVVMRKLSLDRARAESPLEVRPLQNMRNLQSDLSIPPGPPSAWRWMSTRC
jgi:hypothetical protein